MTGHLSTPATCAFNPGGFPICSNTQNLWDHHVGAIQRVRSLSSEQTMKPNHCVAALVVFFALINCRVHAADGPVHITSADEYELIKPTFSSENLAAFDARAAKGDIVAADIVFAAHLFAYGTRLNVAECRRRLDTAYKLGGPLACYYKGRCLSGWWLDPSVKDPVLGRKLVAQSQESFMPFAEKGNAFAMFIVAAAFDALGNPNESTTWFKKSAAAGNVQAKGNLGRIRPNVRPGMTKEEALHYMREAAEAGDLNAMNSLGVYYETQKNKEEALRWFSIGAERGWPDCITNQERLTHFRGSAKADDEQKLADYLSGAEKGDAIAQANLGRIYALGMCVKKDNVLAAKWLKASAAQNNPEGLVYLGSLYEAGLGVPRSFEEAAKCYQRGTELKNDVCTYRLANLYLYGLGVKLDEREAARLFKIVADNGHTYAQHALAKMYRDGKGVKQDDVEAFVYMHKAAIGGMHDAVHFIVWAYRNGRGVPKDEVELFKWTQVAAIGCAQGSYDLAEAYRFGLGTPKDAEKASAQYKLSARQQFMPAILALGQLYREGSELKQDYAEALKWYLIAAADSNNAEGQYWAGMMLLQGLGSEKKVTDGFNLIKKAADHGYADALMELGNLYRDGIGVPANPDAAFKSFESAAKKGHANT